ncbi:MAG: group III truncated hemoglobin [Sphingomonas bacterium]|nr:group III truncated hemoglobin [Sphingomonas bacterium]
MAEAAVTDSPPDITEAQLEVLIPRFYERVRDDALIGPVFGNAIADWDLHLDKLVAFWSSVMLTSGRYKGNPVAAHSKQLSAITPPMFDRWLDLWAEVTSEVLLPAAADALQSKATRIAESLKLALFFRLEPLSTITDLHRQD